MPSARAAAVTSSGVLGPPAIGAATIGSRMPSFSITVIVSSLLLNGGARSLPAEQAGVVLDVCGAAGH